MWYFELNGAAELLGFSIILMATNYFKNIQRTDRHFKMSVKIKSPCRNAFIQRKLTNFYYQKRTPANTTLFSKCMRFQTRTVKIRIRRKDILKPDQLTKPRADMLLMWLRNFRRTTNSFVFIYFPQTAALAWESINCLAASFYETGNRRRFYILVRFAIVFKVMFVCCSTGFLTKLNYFSTFLQFD